MKAPACISNIGKIAVAALFGAAMAAAPVHAQTIKIGAPLALTGGLADEGKKQQIAYDMWLKRVNAQGGFRRTVSWKSSNF